MLKNGDGSEDTREAMKDPWSRDPQNSENKKEDDMSLRSRRGFLLSLVMPFTIAAAACTKATDSQKVAEQFIDRYYVAFSVKEAAALTTGLAKEKMADQLKLLTDAGTEAPSGEPRVTYSLVSSQSSSPEEATYVFKIDVHRKDVGKRMVFVRVRKEGEKWLVTQYTENDAPPSP